MLLDLQIDPAVALAHAALPADLFQRPDSALTPAEYFRLWRGIEQAAGEREVPLLLTRHLNAEAFDAPIFASLCSANFNIAARRLSHYKPLIGPMLLDVNEGRNSTLLSLSCYGAIEPLPRSLGLMELVFLCQLIRMGTRERIVPLAVTLPDLPRDVTPYEVYFGCALRKAERTELRFSATDAARPFMTSNAAMWAFFESKLNQRLADMNADASTARRVRAVLLEALPSGESGIDAVAGRLAMSKRTLQRKLTTEAENFQDILNSTRTELADHYLHQSKLSLGEISFLLGFQEPNSFIRAYQAWKGESPSSFRMRTH
ncbi:AraC family transcriptional regulator ligand-binding domain-containing protein [Paucibacter sp. R3-3]|uniref:AraC family transcriptional regulator ligand-binding domain-containing protein n=1 Tax=Roseateles agri TaxID=3098619 RepID=A0ABU5DQN4_9BURK|nr:AraC family transcriptional regulator ligand-binding domain-containing protein [Paucibacter sp. R3-3]MDY0748038.1 AraC family transcriptional regulator ligand-binding domain-containing protein [Paucibacter sp. R3-3]